ncbi:MAG TPA: methyl-accepting chemotaxis protein, partial [Tepidimicrobium sp.]|nr:methyl-accepting chemotaxis protein [Tepidimicrobium sp.]
MGKFKLFKKKKLFDKKRLFKKKDKKKKDTKKNIRKKEKKVQITSVKTKLIAYFSILILASTAAIGFMLMRKGGAILVEEAERSITLLTKESAKLTASRMETQLRTLEMIAQREDIQNMDWVEQQPVLKGHVQKTDFIDIGVVQLDGIANYSNGDTAELGDREYIQSALNGKANVSDLLSSRVTGGIVVMYAVPIEKDGKVVGALVGRRDGNSLGDVVRDISYGEEGDTYIVDGKGTIIAHSDASMVVGQFNPIERVEDDDSYRSIADLFEKILSEREGVGTYSFRDDDLYAAYTPIDGTDWSFVVTANQNEVLAGIYTLQKVVMAFAGSILLISIIVTYIMGNSIANPIVKIAEHSGEIANLDITQDVSQALLKRKDEIGTLGNALQNIINNLRDIINEVNQSSEQVVATSEELTATTQQSA